MNAFPHDRVAGLPIDIAGPRLGPDRRRPVVVAAGVLIGSLLIVAFPAQPSLNRPAAGLLLLLAASIGFFLYLVIALRQRDRLAATRDEGERQFRRLAEASGGGLLYLDLDGRVSFANARWGLLTGKIPAELRGPAWLEWVDPRDQAEAHALWEQARTCRRSVSADLRYIHPNDGPGWAELSFDVELGNGQPIGFIARLADVSRRRHAERAMQTSEELYRLLAENSHDVIMRFDLARRALYVSSAAQRLLGFQPDELIGQRLDAFIHGDDTAAFQDQFPRPRGQCGDATAQYRFLHKSGGFIWVEASARLVTDSVSGEPSELVASIRDIDRRRRSELIAAEAATKLREGNRLLQLAETLAHIGHWHLDAVTGSFDCSPQVSVMTRLPRTAVVEPADMLARVHREDRFALLRCLQEVRQNRGAVECRVRLVLPGQVIRHVRLVAQSERNAVGAVSGVFGVVRDVTDEVAAQSELIRARDEAEAATRAKSEFLATMSHEIRTPMTGVLGMIDLLRNDPAQGERSQYLATLKQSADLLMAVLNDVLDFSRIESGKIEFEEREFDLRGLLQSTIDLFDGAASHKGLLLSFDHRAAGSALVSGDAVRLQQIVSNLLSNAIKFTSAGTVSLILSAGEFEAGRERWRVEVLDTGIGISPDRIDDLFNPFVQAHAAIARRFGGTGLGLAICQRLVTGMGGEIGVDSQPGAGTRFWFEVPLRDGALAAVPEASPMIVGGKRLEVLVAEDNAVNQLVISGLLRGGGHVPTCVENGRLAVDISMERRFDCILMDMQMPVMDGLVATRTIRRSAGPNADTPIIALTADASPERRRFYDNIGLTDFMTKPIDSRLLANRLGALTGAEMLPPESRNEAPRNAQAKLFDLDRYHELQAVLGPDQVAVLLQMLVGELDQRPARIRQLLLSGDLEGARAEAHSLKGAAGNVGATALGQIAALLESEADLNAMSDRLASLDQHARRTVKAIAALR